ncbi:MAG: hypothetical protein K2K44_00825 [Oscillospiraceae bacterium]|nr:hypothetical protein [Oscillospiraceae bacterium]
MKSKIIFPIILSAMLLTACQEQNQPSAEQDLQEESSITTTLETEAAETETIPETAETSAEADEKETAEIKGNTSSDYFDYFTFDLGKYEEDIKDHPLWLIKPDTHRDCMLLSKNLLCAIYQYSELDQDRQHYLRFYDIDRDEMVAEIPLPENGYFEAYSYEKNIDDVLVKVYFSVYNGESFDYRELTVHKDYSYDIVDDGSTPYPGIDYFNTGIYGNEPGTDTLENLRTNTVLIKPSEGRIALYNSSIDENRFIFKNGYDSYIGIYDYSTGNITEIPDSENLNPIGYYNGKIYAYVTNSASTNSEQGVGEIYSFDIKTFEKKNFMTFHTPDDNAEGSIDCFMTQDCGYMSVVLSYSTSSETAYIVSLDSGEILAKHETDAETNDGELRDIMYADGRVALRNFSTDKLLVLDPKE